MQEAQQRLRDRLDGLDRAFTERARDIAVLLVFDRPNRAEERPGLARTFFAERCLSDERLEELVSAFRSVGAYVELLDGEVEFGRALASGRILQLPQPIKVVYNGVEGGIGTDGFQPGRKALVPAVADAHNLICANSNAYACAIGRHKFHYYTLLRALGIRTPRAWYYRIGSGWARTGRPPEGLKVIVKSTFESWSVGVTESSVFTVDDSCDERAADIAGGIGQPVTVQEFVRGSEVNVPVFSLPEMMSAPPVEAVLTKAPGDPEAVQTIMDNLGSAALSFKPFVATPSTVEHLHEAAIAAFQALELTAFARIDFRVDERLRVWVTDVGVSPGLAKSSSTFTSVGSLGITHAAFIRAVVATSLSVAGALR